jgi:hypothetical protein
MLLINVLMRRLIKGSVTMYRNLGITLDKLLTLDLLKGSRVLAGSNGLSNKITKVNVMEVTNSYK